MERVGIRSLGLVVLVVVVALGAGLFMTQAGQAEAYGNDIEPLIGQWCGMTDDGGSIRLEVTPDSDFVRNVDIRTFSGAVSFREGDTQPGAQIKSGQFLIRDTTTTRVCTRRQTVPGGGSRCVRAPCKGSGAAPPICRNVTEETMQIRGFFEGIDSLRGTFTFTDTQNNNSSRRVMGRFTAWPASIAPCP